MRRAGWLAKVAIGAALSAAVPPPARALTLLTTGKQGVFRSPAGGEASALVRVGRDPKLRRLHDPRCPSASSLRFALSREALDFEDHGEIPLPCDGWRRQGPGYRFRGSAGGVREVVYGPRGLLIRAGGTGFTPVRGPVAYVEAWLTIAGERHLVRFHTFRRNDPERILTRRPSPSAAAGEAAFWDTLWADRPRDAAALALLRDAVRHDPRDGRSQFLLGMLHLYRSGGDPTTFDFARFTEAGKREVRAAQKHLDRAVELLPRDTRVPGFRAATTYANGFVHGDAALVARGLQQLDASIAVNPLFDAFDLFAVVAPVVPGAGDYYQQRVLGLVDFILIDNLDCPAVVPHTCSNDGMAPHNFEGTLLELGDLYAKGGRLADAQFWYGIAQGFGRHFAYRYQAIADERVAHAAERVALYRDADPGNDPPLLGGGGAGCVYCHNK